MSRGLVAVRPTTTLARLQRLLEERRISAVPVIDDDKQLVGIVSTTDIVRLVHAEVVAHDAPPLLVIPPRVAADIMQRKVATVPEDAPLSEAAARMARRHIHRLVVTRAGRVSGIISTRDLMRALVGARVTQPVDDVMTRHVETVGHCETVREALARLHAANVRGLVVVDGGWPIGVFTHTEALRARGIADLVLETPVEEVMSYETSSVESGTPLYRVAGQAMQTGVRRILVVSGRALSGIVTGFDVVRVMAHGASGLPSDPARGEQSHAEHRTRHPEGCADPG
ncbi:MAG: CBS domain-containing protein [Myxococcales bacterium]|nr:CBS domain-containing protein [Myxococcales bacterium]